LLPLPGPSVKIFPIGVEKIKAKYKRRLISNQGLFSKFSKSLLAGIGLCHSSLSALPAEAFRQAAASGKKSTRFKR